MQDSIAGNTDRTKASRATDDSFNEPLEAAGESTTSSIPHRAQTTAGSASFGNTQRNQRQMSTSSDRQLETARHLSTPGGLSRDSTQGNASRLEATMRGPSKQYSQNSSQTVSQRAQRCQEILKGKTLRMGACDDPRGISELVRQCGGLLLDSNFLHNVSFRDSGD